MTQGWPFENDEKPQERWRLVESLRPLHADPQQDQVSQDIARCEPLLSQKSGPILKIGVNPMEDSYRCAVKQFSFSSSYENCLCEALVKWRERQFKIPLKAPVEGSVVLENGKEVRLPEGQAEVSIPNLEGWFWRDDNKPPKYYFLEDE